MTAFPIHAWPDEPHRPPGMGTPACDLSPAGRRLAPSLAWSGRRGGVKSHDLAALTDRFHIPPGGPEQRACRAEILLVQMLNRRLPAASSAFQPFVDLFALALRHVVNPVPVVRPQ